MAGYFPSSMKSDFANYSTNTVKTGQKWIDGKDIYMKTFEITDWSNLPTNRRKSYNIGETITNFIKAEGRFATSAAYSQLFTTDLTNHVPWAVQITDVFPTYFDVYFGSSITPNLLNVEVTLYFTID